MTSKREWEEKNLKAVELYGVEEADENIERKFGEFCDLKRIASNFGSATSKNLKVRVLDVGCGGTRKIVYADYHSKDYEYIGLDPFTPSNAGEFNFVKGVAEKLPFQDKTFDRVLFATSLDHLKDLDLSLREAKRVLKPGGSVCVWQAVERTRLDRLEYLLRKLFERVVDGSIFSRAKSHLNRPDYHTIHFKSVDELVDAFSRNGLKLVDMEEFHGLPALDFSIIAKFRKAEGSFFPTNVLSSKWQKKREREEK